MKPKAVLLLRGIVRDDSGVSMAWAALLLPLILGVGGLGVDLGYAYIGYRELQISTDAAAMAAAAALPNTTAATTAATTFSSAPGNRNAYPILNTPYAAADAQITVTPGCITMSGLPACGSGFTSNAVKVTQTASVRTFFIRALSAFGYNSAKSINLKATAIAAMRGAQRGPYNVAILIDTTASMAQNDGGSNCTGTKVACAEQGAQIMLSQLSPCLPNTTCGTATNGNVAYPVDEVALFTFPAQTAGTQLAKDQTCSGTAIQPSVISYPDSKALGTLTSLPNSTNLATLVSTYGVVPLVSNYRTSDSTTGTNPLTINNSVSASSPSIVNAVGGNSYFGGSSCAGMYAKGGVSTYYAGSLFTAWRYLTANARANAENVIVILSDGDANGSTMGATSTNLYNASGSTQGTYPSSYKQCKQGIDVAAAAKTAGTKIYTVGYGVASGGCSGDSGITACSALRSMASSDSNFFVDTSSVNCTGARTVVMNGKTNSLSAIFSAIVGDLTQPRLVPNTMAFTAS
jgi:Flp pilus assembly protein TadG